MLLLLLIFLAGFMDSIRDSITFKFDDTILYGIRSNWINSPFKTWTNKYKWRIPFIGKRMSRLIFSTVLVFLTDLFHNAKFWNQLATFFAIFISKDDLIFNEDWKNYIFYYLFENLVFTLFYHNILDFMKLREIIPTLAKNVLLVWGLGFFLIAIAIVITPEYQNFNFDWNSSYPGYWLLIVSFTIVPLSSISWIIHQYRENKKNSD